MITEDDARQTVEFDTYYVIQPEFPWWSKKKYSRQANRYQMDLHIQVTINTNG